MGQSPGGLRLLISRQQIREAVERLAREIRRDYKDRSPVLVGGLKGAFIFMADLVRTLDIPLEVDFMRLASYNRLTHSSGRVRVLHGLRSSIRGRHVLAVDDIVDTGLTTSVMLDYLRAKGAASVGLCALLDKPSRRRVPVKIDYLGLTVPDAFVVGYGLDYRERYRHLPDIYALERDDQ